MVDLNFKFISKENYNCIENVMATLMLTWEREYAYMFSRNWGFTILPSKPESDLLGYRIGGGIYNTWECLNEFAGVATTEVSGDSDLQKQILQNELAEGNPVIIKMDGYYAPWKDVYKKYHLRHYCLVINQSEEGCGCLDPYVNSDINLFPEEYFDLADTKCILIKVKEEKKAIDYRQILKEAADIILMEDGGISGIGGIRAFADIFEHNADLQEEKAGYEDMIWVAPMIYQISDIGSRRLNFSETLTALYNRCGFKEVADIADKVQKAGWDWRRIRRTMVSAMDTPKQDKNKKIAEMIRNVADVEETAAKSILSFLEKVN